MTEKAVKKSGYTSRFGLLCVLIGGSVGTGNLWRFPRLVANYGGGFILVMVTCAFLVAIPIIYVENFLGRATRHSAPGAFRDTIGPKYSWMGTVSTIIYYLMTCYYMVVLAWCLRYAIMSLSKSYFGMDKLALFTEITNGDIGTAVLWVVGLILLYICIRKQEALEKASSVIVPVLFVILIGLVIYALTLKGASGGLKYAFTIDYKSIFKPIIWLEALTQCAWSIGPGTMMMIASSKYTSRDEDITLNTRTQAFGDMSFAMLGTLCVLPCIFAFSPSTEAAAEVMKSGNNGLTFIGLTNMFEIMPAGNIVGTLFFICLSFAAFSSAALMTTCMSNILIDIGMKRTKASKICVVAMAIIGIPSIISQDFLTNQDNAWGFGLVFGIVFLGFLTHKFGPEKMRTQFINPVSDIKVNKSFNFLTSRLAPIVTVVVLVAWCIQAIGWDEKWWNPISTSSLGTMLYQWIIVFIIAFAVNNKLNKCIKHNYFNGESFSDVPEEILNEE